MSLKITEHNNFFKLRGCLNREDIHVFQKQFRNIFDRIDKLTISIEDLEGIDRYGVNAIAKLHNESLNKHKSLSIIGLGCVDLYDHFKSSDAA
ncbi:MAG: hypothetical protein KC469_00180 [Flavobacteriaceae bacterium]|jgi:ABC-type transporter Mla MlaB component|nr:hypothetical protein [Flavobacteriaceae bacterium]